MANRRARYTPLALNRTKKTIPLTTRITLSAVDQIEDAARSLEIPRQHIIKAALRLGVPLAIGELTAKAAAAAGGEE